jgi:hypothetical protein
MHTFQRQFMVVSIRPVPLVFHLALTAITTTSICALNVEQVHGSGTIIINGMDIVIRHVDMLLHQAPLEAITLITPQTIVFPAVHLVPNVMDLQLQIVQLAMQMVTSYISISV